MMYEKDENRIISFWTKKQTFLLHYNSTGEGRYEEEVLYLHSRKLVYSHSCLHRKSAVRSLTYNSNFY